jgi:hypothetical protein
MLLVERRGGAPRIDHRLDDGAGFDKILGCSPTVIAAGEHHGAFA